MTDHMRKTGREEAPGGLGVEPEGIVEALMQQEALRYRLALLDIEETVMEAGLSPAAACNQVSLIVRKVLADGEDAVG